MFFDDFLFADLISTFLDPSLLLLILREVFYVYLIVLLSTLPFSELFENLCVRQRSH